MAEISRRHHYLPQFYLAGFTDSGDKHGNLHVTDNLSGKQWTTKPAGVAYQRDFYRVEHRNVEPDAIEKTFAQFETKAARVLTAILRDRELPTDEDFDVLLNLVSLMQVRIPTFRDSQTHNMSQLAELLLDAVLSSPEQWERTVEGMRKDGHELSQRVTYESMKEFHDSKEYTIEVSQNWHLRMLLEAHDTILPLLAQRDWSLLVAEDGAGEFICSDRPVALNWTVEMPAFYPPGLGLKDTELKMPLGKHACLLGSFDTALGVATAGRRVIATVNSMIAVQADRQIMCSGPDFEWMKPDDSLADSAGWIDWIREQRHVDEPE